MLKKAFNFSPLDALPEITRSQKPTAIVSFDDGYLDNFTDALPILEEYQVPAVFFVTGARLGESSGFWWDHLVSIFLQTATLPETGKIKLGSEVFSFSLGSAAKLSEPELENCKLWKFGDPQVNQRIDSFLKIWKILKSTPAINPYAVTEDLMNWAGVVGNKVPCMNVSHLKVISNHPLFSIGVHTMNHFFLPNLDSGMQEKEITACRNLLEDITGKKSNYFAAPYGGINKDTIEILKRLEFKAAFTTENKPTTKRAMLLRPLEIPRIHVTNIFDPMALVQE
jgi:peptidoglycan/xylan/chitin deacetylase (PgdA/CDA1 family)